MQKRQTNTMKGFTIIEVVLVLAIAGLIFLMVFIALPALQRSQRDTQRRDDMSRLMSAITAYQSNNNGKIPTDATSKNTLVNNYLTTGGDTFVDPDGNNYEVQTPISISAEKTQISSGTTFEGSGHKVYIMINAKCKDGSEGVVSYKKGNRNYAVLYKLEGAGIYCGDNS